MDKKRSISPEKLQAAQRLHQAIMTLWRTIDSITLMSYGIAALLEPVHNIGASQETVLKIMNKTLEIGSTSPEALAWQDLMRWKMDTMQAALERLVEIAGDTQPSWIGNTRMAEVSMEDIALFRQAITGQREEPAPGPAEEASGE